MENVARSLVVAALAASLAACAGETGRVSPEQIELPRRAESANDWSRYLPALYAGITGCLNAHPVQPAYAAQVTPTAGAKAVVDVVGADGSRRDCLIDAPEGFAAAPKAVQNDAPAPAFTPSSMPEPFQRCGSNDPVFHKDGRLLGWVTHYRPNCQAGGPAAQQNWRAFGNEPYWSARVAPDVIVFDRLGRAPVTYPSALPQEQPDRWTWLLEAPDGDARNGLELVILNTPCGDTMADRRYDYRAEAMVAGQRLRGCAEKLNSIP